MDDWGAQRRGQDCQNQSLQSSFLPSLSLAPPFLYSDPVQHDGAVLVRRTWLMFTSREMKNHFICLLSLSLSSIVVVHPSILHQSILQQRNRQEEKRQMAYAADPLHSASPLVITAVSMCVYSRRNKRSHPPSQFHELGLLGLHFCAKTKVRSGSIT